MVGTRLLAASALLLAGCAYYNALYNANRRMDDARRAEARRDVGSAQAAYREALDKAAASYRQDPDGRWADDALLLVGRARYGLGEYAEARAALVRVIELTRAEELRADAQAWLGAAELGLGNAPAAVSSLDAALRTRADPRYRLWRARAHFALGNTVQAWQDLEHTIEQGGALATQARLERLAAALSTADSARFRTAMYEVLRDGAAAASGDSVRVLLHAAVARWGPAYAQGTLPSASAARWSGENRDRIGLARARLLLATGDTAAAIADARRVARERNTAADTARTLAASWLLARTTQSAELAGVRALLVATPAIEEARNLLASLNALEVLLGFARQPERALALFAAAELARDELHAPALARTLFLQYTEAAPAAIWAPKALLAVAALEGSDPLQRVNGGAWDEHNPYLSTLRGRSADDAYRDAETRLADQLAAFRGAAAQQIAARERGVAIAMAAADSVRMMARIDSLRIACAGLVSGRSLTGIRADSVRAACMRSDTARITWVLRADTLLLNDTLAARAGRKRGTDTTSTFSW
jgi:hypothetical protein